MDRDLRELYRSCCTGNDVDCYAAFVSYRRAGYTSQTMSREVLYGKTRYQLSHQTPIDFRSLLVRLDVIYRGIEFNDGVRISIQGHRGAYSKPRANLSSPLYTEWEIMFDVPRTFQSLFFPTALLAELDVGLETVALDSEELVKSVEILRAASSDPLCQIRRAPTFHDDAWPASTEITIIRSNPAFFSGGGIYYGMPHLNTFSLFDPGIAPYVDTQVVQDIFDFLRARFGLPEEI